jgi:hypothetical protein
VFPHAGVPLDAGVRKSFFAFRSWGQAWSAVGDFAGPTPGDPDLKLKRLAYAGRTTSSFPGAFEPATPFVGTPETAGSALDAASTPPDMNGVCSETGTPDPELSGRVELMDGGVLDNIPLAWAVRSIAGMPADGPVDRWLLYLHPAPSAKTHSEEPPKQRSVTRLFRLLTSTASVRGDTESVLDDARELRDLTAAATRQAALLRLPLAGGTAKGIVRAARWRLPEYRRAIGHAEAARLRTLLTDPLSIVGPDPLALPPETFPLRDLAGGGPSDEPLPLRAPSDDAAGELGSPADVRLEDLGAASRSPLVAARTTMLLLHMVRDAEARKPGLDARAVRRRLYELRLRCEVHLARRDRVALAIARDNPYLTAAQLLRGATAALAAADEQQGVASQPAEVAADAPLPVSAAQAAVVSQVWPADPARYLWDEVGGLIEDVFDLVREGTATTPTVPCATDVLALAEDPDQALLLLSAVEVLVGPLLPDPFLAPSPVRLAVASAAEVSPLEQTIFGADAHPPTGATRVDRKLCGNQVGNFAAFLSARWRLSDWTWGRMDGAQSLVRIIARPERLSSTSGGAESGFPRDDLRDLYLAGVDPESPRCVFLLDWLRENGDIDLTASGPVTSFSASEVERAVVARLHWDILTEEAPLLHDLHHRNGNSDRPPDSDFLDTPRALLDEQGALKPGVLATFASIGAEVVPELLSRSEMRRTFVEVGLVAWRAALPAGTWGRVVRVVAGLTVAPLLLLPVLLMVLAPAASIVSGVLGAAAVYVAADGMTWLHLPIALAVSGSVGFLVWQKRARSAAWETSELPPDAGRVEKVRYRVGKHAGRAAAGAVAAALLLVLLLGYVVGDWSTSSDDPWQRDRLVAVAALTSLSALLPVFYIAARSGMKGIRQWSLTSIGAALLVAVCAGAAAAGLARAGAPGAWAAARGLYGAMGVTLAALYLWLHVSAVRRRRQAEAASA